MTTETKRWWEWDEDGQYFWQDDRALTTAELNALEDCAGHLERVLAKLAGSQVKLDADAALARLRALRGESGNG